MQEILREGTIHNIETLFLRILPIHLDGKGLAYSINSVFNAGASLLPMGSTILLGAAWKTAGASHLCAARRRTASTAGKSIASRL